MVHGWINIPQQLLVQHGRKLRVPGFGALPSWLTDCSFLNEMTSWNEIIHRNKIYLGKSILKACEFPRGVFFLLEIYIYIYISFLFRKASVS
jgi:hypothetical protein